MCGIDVAELQKEIHMIRGTRKINHITLICQDYRSANPIGVLARVKDCVSVTSYKCIASAPNLLADLAEYTGSIQG